jgi:hypothetical protein
MLGPFRHRLGRWAKNQRQRYILRQPPTHVRISNVWHEALVGQVERQGWRSPVRAAATSFVDIVFDGPPGPQAPRFVEVEDDEGRSIRYGVWVQRDDGTWVLQVPAC